MEIRTKTMTSVYLELNEVNAALVEYIKNQTFGGEAFPEEGGEVRVEMQIRHRTDPSGLPRPEVLGAVVMVEE